MKVNPQQLFNTMAFTPRLTLKCDGIKIKCAYSQNKSDGGWILENFNNDGLLVWYKNKVTSDIVTMIFDKYKDINIIWKRKK